MWRRQNATPKAAVNKGPIIGQPTADIKGLAQNFVKPAYIRLLSAEPALRKGVPILVVAFIITIVVGGVVQTLDNYRQATASANEVIIRDAEILKSRIHSIKLNDGNIEKELADAIQTKPEISARGSGVSVFLANQQGNIVATFPKIPSFVGRDLLESIAQTKKALANELPWIERHLRSGNEFVGAFQNIEGGRFFIYQSARDAFNDWRLLATLTTALTVTTSFVVLVLGFAFFWQSTRAREADQIYETVRTRIDAALIVGRCGLWHVNLATNQIYWSSSMFEILGLKPDDHLHRFNDLSELLHPADIELSELVSGQTIDRVFRMLHKKRGWIWIRLRCEVGLQDQATKYLVGTATELSNQEELNKTYASTGRDQLNSPSVILRKELEIDHLAEKIAQLVHRHVSSDGAVELVGLANELGARVYSVALASNVLSSLLKTYTADDEVRAEIYIDEKLPVEMRRWVLAKELAHYLNTLEGNESIGSVEAYAMALLLPAQQFRLVWERIHDEEALGKWFQVPHEIVKERVRDLKLESTLQ